MGVISIVVGLYLIISIILMATMLEDGSTKGMSFRLFMFGVLIFPIAVVYELWNDYKE